MSFKDAIHNYFAYPLNKEVKSLYWSFSLRRFAVGMIGVFVPIYVFKALGMSLPLLLLYFGIESLLAASFAPLAAKFVAKKGFHTGIQLSAPLLFFFYLLVYYSAGYIWLLLPALFLGALQLSLFSISFNIILARFSDRKQAGRTYGFQETIRHLVSLAAPFIGGVIIYFGDFAILSLIVLGLLIVSLWPLKNKFDSYSDFKDTYKGVWARVFSRSYLKSALAHIGAGVDEFLLLYVWPVFLFGIVNSLLDVGLFFSLSMVATLFFGLWTAKFLDGKNAKRLSIPGGILRSVLWYLATLVGGIGGGFLLTLGLGATNVVSSGSYRQKLYQKLGKVCGVEDEKMAVREVTYNLAQGIVGITMAILVFALKSANVVFWSGALTAWLTVIF